jgi:hypothetical protein
MKSKIFSRLFSIVGALVIFISIAGCSDMFKDPLKDKNTGEGITVLLIDRNFINTKIAIRIKDLVTSSEFNIEPVEIKFVGNSSANLINFLGERRKSFTTSSGFVEVGYDPNVPVSAQSPLEMTVVAISEHYISAPQFLSFTAEGNKDLTIKMIKKFSGKSASTDAFDEPYDLSYNGTLHSDQLLFLSGLDGSSTGTDWEYLNVYATTAAGTFLCNNLTDNVIYSNYGCYFMGMPTGFDLLPPVTPLKTASLQNGVFLYTAILRTGLVKCSQGLTIHLERADGVAGSGLFGYKITFSDGSTKTGDVSFTFPSGVMVEPIYYPSANAAVKVELFGDAQYDISAAVNLASGCGATANFIATPKSNLVTYKFITQYSCPDSPVGMGLSIIGEFRKKGSTGEWTTFEFQEGICELQLEPNVEYDFRVNLDAKYYNYTLPTDVSLVESYLRDNQSIDYQLRMLTIIPEGNIVTIVADIQFGQGVCDLIQ